ncbi:MAG TPA: GNAT family N-acetyltransferase, partial [Aggregatilineales bacterium]|nr:GNAT family N-acetyltransferase [Aggregatilineales bacterium]
MIYRRYQPSDFAAVEALIAAAAAQDRTNRISSEGLRRTLRLMSPIFEWTVTAATERGTVTGFAWWTVENRMEHPPELRLQGWVHPDSRRRGVGTGLLVAIESYARDTPGIKLYGRTYDDNVGAVTLFRRRGYTEARRFYVMIGPVLAEAAFPTPPGVGLRTAQPGDLPALAEAENRFFAGHWGKHRVTTKTYQRAMVESDFDPSLWLLAWANGQIIGQCLCHASTLPDADVWIGTVGVDSVWRNRGLGRALVGAAHARMYAAGFR